MAARGKDGRTLKLQVIGDVGTIKKDVASVNKSIQGLDKKAKTAATAIGGLFVVDKVIDFAKTTINAASDLQESMAKVKVVFGDSADEIVAWSRTSVNAMGMSQQAALEAAGTFGNLFDSLGLAEEASTDMSKDIVQLAADLASFNNVGTEETLLALRSGLLGEAEPMRKFGSALSAARVDAYGFANGMADANGKLSEAAKVQIRYRLMVEDTKNAQGDFARSSGNLAAQQKKLDANMANLSATIGSALVGPLAGFTDWLNDLVGGGGSDFLTKATKGVEKLRVEQEKLAEASEPEPGSWLGSGTIFDSALDGLTGLSDGLMRAIITTDDWADKVEAAGITTGIAEEDLRKLAKAVMDVGGSYEDFARIVGATFNELRSAQTAALITDAWTGIQKVVGDLPPAVEDSVERTKVAIGSLRGAYKRAVADAKDFDREWRFALANPEKGERTANQIKEQMDKAMRRRNRALREGNREAFAIADRQVERLQKKLNSLEQREYEISVRMNLHGQTVGGLLGGAAGGLRKRASGGPVSGGSPYLVGERGPELFVPGSSGGIVPNHSMGGSNYSISVYVAPGGDLVEAGRQMVRAIREYEKRDGRVWRS